MATTTKLLTAEEFMLLPDTGGRQELIRGSVVEMPPPGWRHGKVVVKASRAVSTFVDDHGLGEVATADPGIVLERDPDTVRAPDIAFISTSRLHHIADPTRYVEIPPDLVIEVLSPSDRPHAIRTKTAAWLGFGVRLVWIIDPEARTLTIFRLNGTTAIVGAEGEVDGEDVLPGFRFPIRRFFE